MNNYEYIIAGLPFLSQDGREAPDTEAILADIREQLSEKDAKTLDFLLSAYAPDMPDAAFYLKRRRAATVSSASSSPSIWAYATRRWST